ncbi:MAG: glycosyltransferase family 39 protein, partial [Bacteroidota bacterium]
MFQLLLSALSGVYLFKISLLLFNDKQKALLASLVFSIFPLTFWYVNTFSQECLFQCLLIFMIYHLICSTQKSNPENLIYSAVFFSLAYLTKSHILLFALFVPFIYFHSFGLSRKAFVYAFSFAGISLLFSVPYGLYHYKKGNSYIISSNGGSYQFYLGNTEAGYKTIIDVPSKNSLDYRKLKDINVTAGYFNGSATYYDSILALPQKVKQQVFLNEAINWIKQNPNKFLELKLYDVGLFLTPGFSYRHHPFRYWLISFMLSFPVYVFAYLEIGRVILKDFKHHAWIFYLLLTMVLFSTIWYAQNRFRTITLEPFYLIYATAFFYHWIEKVPIAGRLYFLASAFFLRTKPALPINNL